MSIIRMDEDVLLVDEKLSRSLGNDTWWLTESPIAGKLT